MIDLYNYVFVSQLIFTTRVVPQIWRFFTSFMITKPGLSILMDPYFLYQYGSGLETESSRFSQPGDFFVYTAFLASIILVSIHLMPQFIYQHVSHFPIISLREHPRIICPHSLDSWLQTVPGTEENYPCTSNSPPYLNQLGVVGCVGMVGLKKYCEHINLARRFMVSTYHHLPSHSFQYFGQL